ncbi:MAG: hypothetical protein ACI8ZN_000009 [Bacteroidia bacterium]
MFVLPIHRFVRGDEGLISILSSRLISYSTIEFIIPLNLQPLYIMEIASHIKRLKKNKYPVTLLMVVFIFANHVFAQILPNFGGERAGLSTLSFLKNDMNPMSLGLSGASVALKGNAFSAVTNTAGLTDLDQSTFAASHMLLGAGIHQSFLSYQHKLKNENVIGLSINSLNSGDMEVRTEFQPNGTGQFFNVSQNALGAHYAARLSEMFSLGVGFKLIYETMAGYQNTTAAVDVGFLYKTDFKNLRFAVFVQNFGGSSHVSGETVQVSYNRDGLPELSQYALPTVFKMGFSFDAYHVKNHRLIPSLELNNPNDNSENIRIGLGYKYADVLHVGTGIKLSVKGQSYPTFGFSYKSRVGAHPMRISYAMNATNYMGTNHLLGVTIELNNRDRNE